MSDQFTHITATLEDNKPWWHSRTLWFNAYWLCAAMTESLLTGLEALLPGGLYAWLAFVVPAGNVVLRLITSTGVDLRGDASRKLPLQ